MPFFSAEQIERSLQYLIDVGHTSLISLLAMLRSDVPIAGEGDPIKFGSQQENLLLKDFFSPELAPPDKPFYVPFGPDGGKSRWHDLGYAGSSLQRQRKDRSDIFVQPQGDKQRWWLREKYVDAVIRNPIAIGKEPISIPALAAWVAALKK